MKKEKELLNYFNTLKKYEIIGSSYLFIGQDKKTVFDILKVIGCSEDKYFCNSCWDCRKLEEQNHPDLLIVEPDNLTTRIESIRNINHFLSLKSFRLKKKLVVISDAGSLSLAAANAFLKTLEEPPKNSFLALCTSKLEGILPTINSRCRKIFLSSKEETIDNNEIREVSEFLSGQDKFFKDRKKFASFLWTLIVILRGGLLSKLGYRNNGLPSDSSCEIILRHKSPDCISEIISEILKIYQVYSSVNINLALNLVKMQLGQL